MSDVDAALLLQMSADIKGLERQMARAGQVVDKTSGDIEKRAAKATENVEKSFAGMNVGEAIEKTFSRARLGLIEEGGAKIGIFGSALEALGPAGIAAGAGLVAAFEGFEKAKEAAEYADVLEDTAKKLGITTTALQEFDFIALKAGVSTEEFRAAILSGQQAFGAFISNVGDAKVKQAFAALKISKDQARSLGDFGTALPVIATGLKNVGNSAEEAQIAKKLNIEALLPALKEGGTALEGVAQQAHQLGLVMDEDLIEKGAEANKQLEIAAKTIDVDLKTAFIELAPAIVAVSNFLAQATTRLTDFLGVYNKLGDRPTSVIQHEVDAQRRDAANIKPLALLSGAKLAADGRMSGGLFNLSGQYNHFLDGADEKQEELANRSFDSALSDYRRRMEEQRNATARVPEKGDGSDKAEKAAQRLREAQLQQEEKTTKDIASAQERQLAAEDNDGRSIEERAGLAAERVAIARKARDKELADEAAKFKNTKGLQGLSPDQVSEISAANAKADAAEDANASIKVAHDLQDAQIKQQRDLLTLNDQQLSDQEGLAKTAADRRALALQIYDAERAQLRVETARDLDRDPNLTADQRSQRLNIFDANTAFGRQVTQHANLSPLEQWRDASLTTAGQIEEAYEKVAASGLDSLTSGITDAITGTKMLGDAFHDMATSIIADLVKIAVQRSITQPLANLLFPTSSGDPVTDLLHPGGGGLLGGLLGLFGAHADGGLITGPGGPRTDSIPARLSNGEFVMPADKTAKFLPALNAMRNGLPGFADGGLVGYPTPERGPELAAAAPAFGALRPPR